MKRFAYILIVLAIVSCGTSKEKEAATINGAYNMLGQKFGGSVLDTIITKHKQLKIYTGGYMMYVRLSPEDSLSAFGIGTYTADTAKLIENITYSAADTIESKSLYSDTINLSKTPNGLKQSIPKIRSEKGDISLDEVYESVGKPVTAPIDGVWKQVAGYSVKGADTTHWNDVQYKAFYGGNFAFGNVETDKHNITHAGISYGTFSMAGTTVKETITASTWSALNGQQFEVTITMNGTDAFTQNIVQKDGTIEVLVYNRLK